MSKSSFNASAYNDVVSVEHETRINNNTDVLHFVEDRDGNIPKSKLGLHWVLSITNIY